MRKPFGPLPFAILALTAIGCVIESTGRVGQPCTSDDECGDPLYRCVEDVDGVAKCLTALPPEGERDGGRRGPRGEAFWCSEVELILDAYCVSCHVPGGASGIQVFRLDTYENVGSVAGAYEMSDRIRSRIFIWGDMPPLGHEPLPTDEERDDVAIWAENGAPFCWDGGSP